MSEDSGSGTAKRSARKAADPAAPKPRARRAVVETNSASDLPATPAVAAESDFAMDFGSSAGPRRVEATAVSITQGGAAEVEAESVSVTQGGIGAASAEDITVNQGGIGRAEADDIAVRFGGVAFARGERISVELGGVGIAVGNEVRLTQAGAQTILARNVVLHKSGVRNVLASNVTFEGTSGTFILLARKVEGNVRTVLDWRGALALGAGLGLVAGLFRLRGAKRD